jgi:hypothetical protein
MEALVVPVLSVMGVPLINGVPVVTPRAVLEVFNRSGSSQSLSSIPPLTGVWDGVLLMSGVRLKGVSLSSLLLLLPLSPEYPASLRRLPSRELELEELVSLLLPVELCELCLS